MKNKIFCAFCLCSGKLRIIFLLKTWKSEVKKLRISSNTISEKNINKSGANGLFEKFRNSIFVRQINWFLFKVVSNHKVTTVENWFVSKHSANSKTSSDHIKLDQAKWPEPNHIYDCYVNRAIKNVLNTKTVVGFF